MRAAWHWYNRYRAHPDPRAAAANTLALVLAYNGPCFPLYVYLIVGRSFWPALLPMWAVPLFALVPVVMRRDALAGRVLLVVLGTLNTTIYVLLFSTRSELQVFLLPCIALGLLFHRRERWLGLALAGIPLVLFVCIRSYPGASLTPYTDAQFTSLATLSDVSVATLTWFLVVLFGDMVASGRPLA